MTDSFGKWKLTWICRSQNRLTMGHKQVGIAELVFSIFGLCEYILCDRITTIVETI